VEGGGRRVDELARELDPARAAGLVVDRHGRRFVDEHGDPVWLARDLAKLQGWLEEQDQGRCGRAGAQPDDRSAPPGGLDAPACTPAQGDDHHADGAAETQRVRGRTGGDEDCQSLRQNRS